MKLIQLSRRTCPPCQAAKHLVSKLDQSEHQYEYVDLEDEDNYMIYAPIFRHLNYQKIPVFLAIENDEIKDHWNGFQAHRIKDFFKGELYGNKDISIPLEEIRGTNSDLRE